MDNLIIHNLIKLQKHYPCERVSIKVGAILLKEVSTEEQATRKALCY